MLEEIISKIKANRKIIDILTIFIIAIILSVPMMDSKLDIYLDDGSQHLMRAYYTYKSLIQNGNDNVILDFANGFGYSWNLFYGPLSSYLIIVFGVICGAFNIGFKITMFTIIFLAGLAMYKLIKEILENDNCALLTSIIYMTSPYLFTDIYVRHAMGEAMSFIWIPFVFLGLYNLFNTSKNHYYLIFRKCTA